MDEAAQRVRQALAKPQGISPGAVMTEAHRLARKAIKAQYQARGLKPAHIERKVIVAAAHDYLRDHPELQSVSKVPLLEETNT